MDLRPWNYWTRDGQPYPETREIESALQQVIAANRNHPGALHYWVHLWESTHPERAEAEADRLLPLMPGAGHIVHMPAHIYMRLGRFADVVSSNERRSRPTKTTSRSARRRGSIPSATTHTTFTSSGWERALRAAAVWRSNPRARSRRSFPRRVERCSRPPGLCRRAVLGDGAVRAMVRTSLPTRVRRISRRSPTARGHSRAGMALSATGRLDEAEKELAELKDDRGRSWRSISP